MQSSIHGMAWAVCMVFTMQGCKPQMEFVHHAPAVLVPCQWVLAWGHVRQSGRQLACTRVMRRGLCGKEIMR